MRSERIGKNALKITLTAAEIKGAGICPGELLSRGGSPYELVKALRKRLIWDNALDELIPDNFGERPTVEVIPAKDKGCVIYITGDRTDYSPPQRYAALFIESRSLLAVSRLLCRASLSADAALWANRNSALLIFRLPQRKCPLSEEIREYSPVTAVNEHIRAAVAEHFDPILERNAPEILLQVL